MYSTGFGETYALGHGDTKTLIEFKLIIFPKITTRASISKTDEVEKVACGLAHSGCIKNGKIYLWGIYSNKTSNIFKIPTQIDVTGNLFNIKISFICH